MPPCPDVTPAPTPPPFNILNPATDDEIRKIISRAPVTSCPLDPLPAWLFKDTLDTTLPTITAIINSSLRTGIVPDSMKKAVVRPLLKKSSLNPNELKNYRPVSNLPYISKILERVVASKLNNHMIENGLHEPLQSAYKSGHSTETALIRVHNDILASMDQQKVTVLVMLDLSAAFDTIDHQVLLDRMQQKIGLDGIAHDWFKSYLTNRSQSVCIDQIISIAFLLLFGVPRGSVLGPLLFLIYILPLGDIIRAFGYLLHIYADDTQIYLSIEAEKLQDCVPDLERCLCAIHTWMSANFLKLNSDKTEVLIFGTRQQLNKCTLSSINVAGINVGIQTKPVRNLGVVFNNTMSMADQVTSVAKSVSYQIHNISKIRKHLTTDATKKLVNAVVTSRLDYSNALLAGAAGKHILRLQKIQHSAARLICGLSKYDHITSTLIDLHWLPISFRIDFKIAATPFKAIHGLAPGYISDQLVYLSPGRTLRSARNELLLRVPNSKLPTAGERTFRANAPRIWNKLPQNIRLSKDLNTFKRNLKTYYFKCAFKL